MSDEIDYAREVNEEATQGPWEQRGDGDVVSGPGAGWKDILRCDPDGHNVRSGADARAIALWGSTRWETMAVIEAAAAFERLAPHYCGNSPHYGAALDAMKALRAANAAYRAAVRRFREAQDG